MFFVSCVSHAFAFVHCCLVVTCWDMADTSALFGDVYCIFVTFPCGVLGQVWYLIVSFPDLSYFHPATPSVQNACLTLRIMRARALYRDRQYEYCRDKSASRYVLHLVLKFIIITRDPI